MFLSFPENPVPPFSRPLAVEEEEEEEAEAEAEAASAAVKPSYPLDLICEWPNTTARADVFALVYNMCVYPLFLRMRTVRSAELFQCVDAGIRLMRLAP
jgi:hypothetical protein